MGTEGKLVTEANNMIAATVQTHLPPIMQTVNEICDTITEESVE
jgi:hypothetical protein